MQHTSGQAGRYLAVAGLAVIMGLSYELFVFPNSFAPGQASTALPPSFNTCSM